MLLAVTLPMSFVVFCCLVLFMVCCLHHLNRGNPLLFEVTDQPRRLEGQTRTIKLCRGNKERIVEEVRILCQRTAQPKDRAGQLVKEIAGVYRVGEKLATLFVSMLSVPALAPGLTPWFPAVEGSSLVVLDTNVNRALDYLRGEGATQTYEARAGWLREQASTINLKDFHPGVPSTSARLVQQALYYFCSKSNRTSHQDPCQQGAPCLCPSEPLCPF